MSSVSTSQLLSGGNRVGVAESTTDPAEEPVVVAEDPEAYAERKRRSAREGLTHRSPYAVDGVEAGHGGRSSSMAGPRVTFEGGVEGRDEEQFSFFARGRDFESSTTVHKFTKRERVALLNFDSSNYFPANSQVFRDWVSRQGKIRWERWFFMGLLGFVVAVVNIFLHQFISVITHARLKAVEHYVEENDLATAWGVSVAISVALVFVSAGLVVYVEPAAAASGVPEVIAFLNGVRIPRIFNLRTLWVKFISCVCAVASGLPVGPEGPIIHMGAILGAGLSQFKSKTTGIEFKGKTFQVGASLGNLCLAMRVAVWFPSTLTIPPGPLLMRWQRFRNVRDRRDFITAGVATGVSAAFGAPIGGLLFAFEEVASFWNQQLGWKIFFACMIAVFFSQLVGSFSEGFELTGARFGTFTSGATVLYQTTVDVTINALIVIPAVLLGVLGGVLGSAFTFLNVKLNRWRRRYIVPYRWLRVLEPCLLMVVFASFSVVLPQAFSCTARTECVQPPNVEFSAEEEIFSFNCIENVTNVHGEHELKLVTGVQSSIERFTCDEFEHEEVEGLERNTTVFALNYNQFASLIFVEGEEGIHQLFSRRTYEQLDYGPLFTMLVVYFFAACYAAGTAVSSGLVVPMLFIGALYGRIVGLIVYQISRNYDVPSLLLETSTVENLRINDEFGGPWAWIDPGVFALIGAGSFFGGVSRLTLSLTIIMIEISNDIHMLLPMMIAIIVAKWIADYTTHSLYHALLELKCMPFLDDLPAMSDNLETISVTKIMSVDLKCVAPNPSLESLRELLNSCAHNGFPVVEKSEHGPVIVGFILRSTIDLLMCISSQFHAPGAPPPKPLAYDLVAESELRELRNHNTDDQMNALHDGKSVNLRPYMNESVFTVADTFSLERAFLLFRSMGLRHLPVVNRYNVVIGMITRNDLLGHEIHQKLHPGQPHKH